MKYLFVLGILCVMVVACKAVQSKPKEVVSSSTTNKSSLEEVAREKYPNGYRIKTNEDNSYSLVIGRTKAMHDLFPEIEFSVFEHASGKVIFEDRLKAGAVKWENKHQVQAIARNLKEEDGTTRRVYYYDVRTRKKTEVKSSK